MNSTHAVIVLHEIYGRNRFIEDFCSQLKNQGFEVICPDLIGGEKVFGYRQEKEAYRHFIKQVPFAAAAEKIKKLIADIRHDYKSVTVFGFSVGATIAYLCGGAPGIDGVVGFYGSRIRDYAKLIPACPTLLMFPKEEPSFDVHELIRQLPKEKVQVLQYPARHGFADPYAAAYDEQAAQKAFCAAFKFLKTVQKN